MKYPAIAAFLLAFLLAAAPASALDGNQVDPGITNGTAAREFKQAREKWLKRGISDYRMTAHRSCFCGGPFKTQIRVRDRKPVRISDRPWYGPRTVPGMFRIISQAIKRKVAMLDVRYDRKLGFPKRASIDYIEMAADDEMYYRINHFRKLRR